MEDAIDMLAEAATPKAVTEAMLKAAEPYDVVFASHRTARDGGFRVGHTTTPSRWVEHYFGSGYDKVDPCSELAQSLRGGLHRAGGFSYETPRPGETWSREVAAMMADLRDTGVYGSCYVVDAPPAGGVATLITFMTEAAGPQFDAWVCDHGPRLRLLAAVANARLNDGALLAQDAPMLTEREREALRWLAQGLRVDGIADKMGVSNRTVEAHLASARGRFGAATREQALAIALTTGALAL